MKYAKFVAVVFVLYFLGYVLGPTITPFLVSERKDDEGLIVTVKYKGGDYTINLDEIRDNQLPQTVRIEKPVQIPTENGNGKVRLQTGDVVTLLNRKGKKLIVEQKESMGKGEIDPVKTDLFQQLARQIAEGSDGGGAVAQVPPAKPKPAPIVPKADPEPAPKADPIAAMPKPKEVPAAAPPKPKATQTGPIKLSAEEIVDLMKASIGGGAVKEFSAKQVKGWKAAEDETIDGTEYQTGLVAYEAETIFGVRPVQAKALIKDGKVERWVYAKSGMEIQ